jgi:large subunit ribosomal protein L23
MSKESLMTVLLQPHVSEKSAILAEKRNQYVFRVKTEATRDEVKKAVELMFEVKVEDVNVLNRPAKRKKFKNIPGVRKAYKKAYVSLASGQSIDFTGGAAK